MLWMNAVHFSHGNIHFLLFAAPAPRTPYALSAHHWAASGQRHLLFISKSFHSPYQSRCMKPAGRQVASSCPASIVHCSPFHWYLAPPSTKLFKPLGKVIVWMLRLKSSPNVKLLRSLGKVTFSMLWLKPSPNVKLCKPCGKVKLSMF